MLFFDIRRLKKSKDIKGLIKFYNDNRQNYNTRIKVASAILDVFNDLPPINPLREVFEHYKDHNWWEIQKREGKERFAVDNLSIVISLLELFFRYGEHDLAVALHRIGNSVTDFLIELFKEKKEAQSYVIAFLKEINDKESLKSLLPYASDPITKVAIVGAIDPSASKAAGQVVALATLFGSSRNSEDFREWLREIRQRIV